MNPKDQGYFFPAEWHPHEATWLSWPKNPHTWPNGLSKVYPSYARFIKIIAQGELVHLLVDNLSMQHEAIAELEKALVDLSKVQFHIYPTNDAWIRDYGPSFLIHHKSAKRLVVDWEYNAWGGKYPPFDFDNAIPAKIAAFLELPAVCPEMIMEGGSVDFNGAGTVLTTTSCLLHPNRNPGLSQDQIEKALMRYYGVRQVLWLKHGIVGDDTDGHIDDVARFVSDDTVVAAIENDPKDDNYPFLQANLEELKQMKLWDGRPLKVVTLPMPRARYWQGRRLPLSYANFYISHAAVVVPTFEDPQDQKALNTLQDLFIDRPVTGIDSRHLIHGLGSFHCLSQQEPKP